MSPPDESGDQGGERVIIRILHPKRLPTSINLILIGRPPISCGYDFLVAFSCRSRGVCPSCNARRMALLNRREDAGSLTRALTGTRRRPLPKLGVAGLSCTPRA